MLVIVLLAMLGISAVLSVSAPLVHSSPLPLIISSLALGLLCAAGYVLTRRGRVQLVAVSLTVILWIFFTVVFVFSGGIHGPGPFNYITVITISAVLLGFWPGIFTAALSLAAACAMVFGSSRGVLPQARLPSNPMSIWLTFSMNISLASLFLAFSSRSIKNALNRAQDSENRLRESNRELEKRGAELKKTQQQLIESRKLEAVGRLAGGVAHDFNNLLTVIRGYTELLLLKDRTRASDKADLQGIREAAERASDLTQQLLAFSRRQVLQPRVLSFNEIIDGLEQMMGRLIGEHIELDFRLEPSFGSVEADPGRMEQVFLNLMLNARDAMPGGGSLTIETANVEFDESDVNEHPEATAGNYVMVAVSDTGVGMDRETILLVEDEDKVRDLIKRVLQQRGYTVLSASRASEALRQCRERGEGIDLLVTDVVMPGGMSGPELAGQLKSQYPGIAVLFMWGYTDRAILHHGVLDPDINFMQKPFAPTALAAKVREVLDSAT